MEASQTPTKKKRITKPNGKPINKFQKKRSQPHLILSLKNQKVEEAPQIKDENECKYKISCAHLRMIGKCSFKHQKSHYLLLNIVPPANCLEDVDQNNQKLTKKERKQAKIIEKTIKENIDVDKLYQRQKQIKKQIDSQNKALKNSDQIDQKEKIIQQLMKHDKIEQIYALLSKIRGQSKQGIAQIKRRYLMQLKKKKEDIFKQLAQKQYKVVSRLIKNAFKFNRVQNLEEDFLDINHDTPKEIKQWYHQFFKPQTGIPLQFIERQVSNSESSLSFNLIKLFPSIFHLKPEQYEAKRCIISQKVSTEQQHQIKLNKQFFNLILPYQFEKKSPYIKFFYFNFAEEFSLQTLSKLFLSEYLNDFHSKCKGFPDYLFGQREKNIAKFQAWLNKLKQKYDEITQNKVHVFIFNNFDALLKKIDSSLGEFEQQKLLEALQICKAIIEVFQPVIYYLNLSQKMIEKHKSKVQQIDPLLKQQTLDVDLE